MNKPLMSALSMYSYLISHCNLAYVEALYGYGFTFSLHDPKRVIPETRRALDFQFRLGLD